MASVTPGSRAAAVLRDEREALARSVTGALYRESPGLLDRYGERGREKCLQDMRHNWEHLEPAVEFETPGLFAEYARWVDGVLRSRGVDPPLLARCFELMDAAARERLDEDGASAVSRALGAGLAALEGGKAG
jgi:hypothetical protein